MSHACRRRYNASELSSPATRRRQLELLAVPSTRCRGTASSLLCSEALSADLGIAATLPLYDDAQRLRFLARFAHPAVRRAGVRPTPWLSLRRRLEDPPWPLPSWLWRQPPGGARLARDTSSTTSSAAFFYANDYVDLALFTHFFAHPTPVLDGTYVEIGGSNGVHASNTLFFEQHLNWSGVLIEPTPCGRCVLPHTRPRDVTINAGACVVPGNLSFGSTMRASGTKHFKPAATSGVRPFSGDGVAENMASQFCPAPQDACVARSASGYSGYSPPCLPMHALLPRTLTHIDLLSVDVEDHVLQVLRTMPWGRTPVDVVLAECRGSALAAACTQILRSRGFRVLTHLGFGGDVLAVREACLVG